MVIAALILSVLSLLLGMWTTMELMAQKKSTHQIQMVPATENLSADSKELEKFMNTPTDDELFV